jgi:hypothetical protein
VIGTQLTLEVQSGADRFKIVYSRCKIVKQAYSLQPTSNKASVIREQTMADEKTLWLAGNEWLEIQASPPILNARKR